MTASWGGLLLSEYKFKKSLLWILAIIIISSLTALSLRQATYWRNERTLYEHALTIEPDSPFLHTNYGKSLYESGKTEAAIDHFLQALQVKPDSPGLLKNLGTAFYAAGKFNKAEACLQKALTLEKGNIEAGHRLAKLYLAFGNPEKAAMIYKSLLSARPEYCAEICYNLSSIYSIQNKQKTAVAWLKKSIDSGFTDIELLKNDNNMKNIKKTKYYNEFVNKSQQ